MIARALPSLLAASVAWTTMGQVEPIALRPTLGGTPVITAEAQQRYLWYEHVLSGEAKALPAEQGLLDSLLNAWGETYMGPCAIIGAECSWYCGGGPDTVWASSTLRPVGTHRYDAMQAHDLDYCTAWCEGVPGAGIGESITYLFAHESPRLHTVSISNGLVTSERAWRANNRVMRLRMDENGVPVAILELADDMADQHFKLPRLFGHRTDGQPMRLTFTILGVYPGERHDDTVITEIWFDGTDVH